MEKASKIDNQLELVIEDSISALVTNDDASNTFLPILTINDNIEAPIKKGDVLGKISYEIDGITYSSNLLANKNVEESNFFKSISSVFSIILKISICLIILYVLLIIFKNSNKPKRRKRYDY